MSAEAAPLSPLMLIDLSVKEGKRGEKSQEGSWNEMQDVSLSRPTRCYQAHVVIS